jgi:hypothetical protein
MDSPAQLGLNFFASAETLFQPANLLVFLSLDNQLGPI